ncbi:hypothetical protein [Clostridium sp.]|uniref:hypothetical protein n=1 Tax=Clostridium sp. TaxID=1506 RepID=UPI003F31B1F0
MARSVAAIEVLVSDLVQVMNKDLYLGALTDNNITTEVCFDCSLWNNGYVITTGTVPQTIIPPVKTTVSGILTDIVGLLNDELSDSNLKDFGFKTQIERLLTIIQDLQNKINSIQCNNTCSDVTLTSQLLATLVMTVGQVLTILELLNGLLSYIGTCGCIGSKLFDLLMGKFINSITDLQGLMQDWYGIVMTFFQYSAMPSKSYVASYMPRQQIAPPPMPNPTGYACVPAPPQPRQCGGYPQQGGPLY